MRVEVLRMVFILSIVDLSSAASPLPLTEPSFQPDSNGRGTISLVTSCILTLLLAVYTAIHLNINPSKGWWAGQWWPTFREKLGWMLIATLAPELVIWIAIGQLQVARKVVKSIKDPAIGPQNVHFLTTRNS
jgi:hypothetical protein